MHWAGPGGGKLLKQRCADYGGTGHRVRCGAPRLRIFVRKPGICRTMYGCGAEIHWTSGGGHSSDGQQSCGQRIGKTSWRSCGAGLGAEPLKNIRQARALADKKRATPYCSKPLPEAEAGVCARLTVRKRWKRPTAKPRPKAGACFGDGEMYLEKLIEHPRHIEFQILADAHIGHVVHLGERECSIQRRRQKLIEEAPSWALSDALRREMGEKAVAAAREAGYVGAGTVEFVLAPDGAYYFIEMNTRIQVEHPVTEMVTGVDLVKEQLRIAAGLPLTFTQDEITLHGHALECRINAEDPQQDFRPCPGTVEFLHVPGGPGVRVDTALFTGCVQCRLITILWWPR